MEKINFTEKQVLKIKVQLDWMSPSNYRTFLLSSKETFYDLHKYIQNHFWFDGWHLWNFDTHIWEIWDEWKKPEKVVLWKVFSEKWIKINYCYDYWDNWNFTITCQGIEQDDWKKEVPQLLKTQWTYLLEDSGWIWGFAEYLEDYNNNRFNDDLFDNNEDFREYMESCFKEVTFFNHHKES